MDLTILFYTIMKLAILIGIGMFLAYKISFSEDIRQFLVFIIINISLPALIISSFLQVTVDRSLLGHILIVFLFSFCYIVASLIITGGFVKVLKFKSNRVRETAFLSAFGNTGFIGIPLCASIFGAKGAVLAAAYDAGNALLLWSIGVLLMQDNRKLTLANLKKMINAPNIAVILGVLLAVNQFNPGILVKDVLSSVASLASPSAMIYIGMLTMTILKERNFISTKLIAIPVSLKIVVFPLIGLGILTFINIPPDLKYLILIQMAMPSITTASIIFAMNKADEKYALMHTLLTCFLSLLTIPLLIVIGGLVII